MYQKYHTDALVLGSREQGESDRTCMLYTAEFGLVYARASAVRSEKSKMRYAMQHYTYARVSLVKGKRGWRVAGATALRVACGDMKGIASFARIAQLVNRLVQGEEKNDYLFATLIEAHTLLTQEKVEAAGMIELVCVARLLYSLGYISNEALNTALFSHTAYTGASLLEAETMQDVLLRAVNQAIAQTHL